jgi:hypothetical protein
MTGRSAPQAKRYTSCGGDYLLKFFRFGTNANRRHSLKPDAQLYRDRCIGYEAMRKREESAYSAARSRYQEQFGTICRTVPEAERVFRTVT